MGRLLQLLTRASASGAWWPGCPEFSLADAVPSVPLKVLLVVAHPDDESECAATLYRITHGLGGVVDQVIVTNGAGGQHFSAPGLEYYGLSGSPGVAKALPRLRRREVMRAGQIIGIRNHYFLEQDDTGFTLDPAEGLRSWNLPWIRRQLQHLLQCEGYDLVLTLLPTQDTHGHHKTVAMLALEAAAAMPCDARPAVAGVRAASPAGGALPVFHELDGFPGTRTTSGAPVWAFDRRTPLLRNAALDHSIIVHWVIAEHKSQGMFQMEYGRNTHEYVWQFATGQERWDGLWQRFGEPGPVDQQLAGAEAA